MVDKEEQMTDLVFTGDILDGQYRYRVLKMTDSVFIYIGNAENEIFNDLAFAVPSDQPLGTAILGIDTMSDSKEVAIYLSQKLKKTVFVSCNFPSDNLLKPLILKKLTEKINDARDSF